MTTLRWLPPLLLLLVGIVGGAWAMNIWRYDAPVPFYTPSRPAIPSALLSYERDSAKPDVVAIKRSAADPFPASIRRRMAGRLAILDDGLRSVFGTPGQTAFYQAQPGVNLTHGPGAATKRKTQTVFTRFYAACHDAGWKFFEPLSYSRQEMVSAVCRNHQYFVALVGYRAPYWENKEREVRKKRGEALQPTNQFTAVHGFYLKSNLPTKAWPEVGAP